jgi:hypothetical protein
MISSPDDQNAKGNQSNDFLIAVRKSLNLDDVSNGQTRDTYGCEPSNKEFAYLKIRVHSHDGKELHSPAGAAASLPIDADPWEAVHEIDRRSDDRRVVGRHLVRTVAFGVLTGVMVSAGFAWHFYGDAHSAYIVDSGKAPSSLVSMKSPGSNVTVEQASKTSDRVPTQDQAALPTEDQVALPTEDQAALPTQNQGAPILAPGQVSVTPGSSPDLQDQLESLASDVAVVRRIVERLAAVQEQMALDMVTLQKTNHASQRASLLPHAPAVPAPSRQYAPNIVRSTPFVAAPSAPARTPAAPH